MRLWLKTLFARKSPTARRHTGFRPGLEFLEDRLTPSAVGLINPPEAAPPSSHSALSKAARPKASIKVSVVSLGSTKLRLVFEKALGQGAEDPATYRIPGLKILGVRVSGNRKVVTLTTSPQKKSSYTVRLRRLFARDGTPVRAGAVIFTTSPTLTSSAAPRVVGAASTGNRSVMVSFSQSMSDSALDPHSYAIGQANVNAEAGLLRVLAVRFLGSDHRA